MLGAGPVGLLGAMALVASGLRHVRLLAREPAAEPQGAARRVGRRPLRLVRRHALEALPSRIGNIDVVYEASGASSVSFEVMKLLGTNGIFVFTGVPGRKAPIEVDTDLIMRNLVLKNQVVFGTVNAGREAFEAAIRDLDAVPASAGRRPCAR